MLTTRTRTSFEGWTQPQENSAEDPSRRARAKSHAPPGSPVLVREGPWKSCKPSDGLDPVDPLLTMKASRGPAIRLAPEPSPRKACTVLDSGNGERRLGVAAQGKGARAGAPRLPAIGLIASIRGSRWASQKATSLPIRATLRADGPVLGSQI